MSTQAPAPLLASPIFAYVAPFGLFMILGLAETWSPLQPYYPWVYSVKVLAVGATWWAFRSAYPSPSRTGLGLGVAFGVVGVLVWITLSLWNPLAGLADALPEWLAGWLIPERVGFDPSAAIEGPFGRIAFVTVRLIGLALVVPLMEEVFWRGFLLRYLIAEDFAKVPIGAYTPMSFALVTGAFVAVHPEILAALVWGAGINLLLYRTKNLWACIVAHSVTNLLLGIYVLETGTWWLW